MKEESNFITDYFKALGKKSAKRQKAKYGSLYREEMKRRGAFKHRKKTGDNSDLQSVSK